MITLDNFKTLTDDLCFKYVFSKELILEDFINSFFDYINSEEYFKSTTIVPESYIMPNNKEESLYFGDITSTSTSDSIISLEMYRNTFNANDYIKSKGYMCRLFDSNIEKNNYKDAKKVFNLNIMKGNFRRANNNIVNKYSFVNEDTHANIDNNLTVMYLIRFDKVEGISYNKDEQRFITWLRLICAESLEEMEKYIKEGDKIMSETEKFVAEWNRKSAKNGLERYIEKQKNEAAEEAKNESILQTAKNLLSLNINIEDIKKATGLSDHELNKLKKQLN